MKFDKKRSELCILTDEGFKSLNQIKVGDIVFDGKGNKTKVKSIKKYSSPDYSVYFNNSSIVSMGENIIIPNSREIIESRKRIKDKNGKPTNRRDIKYKTINYSENMKDFFNTFSNNKPNSTNKRKYITNTCKFKGLNKNLPLDPYLLGLLLGDGNLTGEIYENGEYKDVNGSIIYTVNINDDPDILAYLKKIAKKYNDEVVNKTSTGSRPYDFRINGQNIRNILKDLNIWGKTCYDKYVPIEYLMADENSRLELLRGLMDTDGSCYYKKKSDNKFATVYCEFDNTSKKLVEDVGFLAYSLGGKTNKMYSKPCSYTNKSGEKIKLNTTCYRYLIRMPKDVSIFKCKRKKNREKLRLKDSYKGSFINRSIEDIKKSKNKKQFCKLILENGNTSFIGNNFIEFRFTN